MKKCTYLLAFVAAGLMFSSTASAQSTGVFEVQASVPKAVSINFNAFQASADAAGNIVLGAPEDTTLNFDDANGGELVYDAVNGIWTAPTFFVIDFAGISAGGQPAPPIYNNVSLEFTETNNPNANGGRSGERGAGVGEKVTATVLQWNFTEEQFIQQVSQSSLGSIPDFHTEDVVDGTARVILAVADGSNPAVGLPFTNADLPGPYTGTLTITAVLD
jgi:hypothetical protein